MWLPHSFIALLLAVLANGSPTNTTIDDSSSSFTFTGASGGWNTITPTSPCDICSSNPDPSLVHDGTWHDGNIRSGAGPTTGSFTFQGSAVYIFGIDQAESQPDIAFTLGSIQSVHHYTGTEQFVYNALFFSATGLAADQTYTVNWQFNVADTGVVVQAALFDYAIVTSGEEDSTTTTPAPATTGATGSSQSTTSPAVSKTHSSGSKGQTSGSPSGSSRSTIPSSSGTLPGAQSMSSLTITVDGTISVVGTATVTSTPQAAVVSDSKSNNMAPIIGGVLGALAVAALVILFLFFRSRRVRRVRLETDKGARSQFLRLEDYPLHSARRSLPRSDTRPPSAQYTSSSKTRAEPGALSTTSLLPQTPTTSAQTSPSEAHDATDAAPEQPQPEVEPPARINAQPSRDSGYRVLEERLATLEAQVADQQQPPPYVQED